MDKNLFTLLKNYLTGNISGRDREEINNWYDNLDKADARFINPFIKRRVKDNIWANIQASTGRPEDSIPLRRYRSVAAAVIILATAGLFFIFHNQTIPAQQVAYQTITVPAGATRQVTLSDGSHIWLNSGSVFSYPAKFSDTSRLVKLIRGEAFFKISKDPQRPFRIGSEKITTSVVGTSFNIRTLNISGLYQIRVMTGKVRVSSGHTLLATLTKNFGLNAGLYTGQKIALITHHETEPNWMSGKIMLESASFNELSDVMEQYYGVQVKSTDPNVLQGTYSISFNRRDNLDTVLEIISSINRMEYSRRGNQVIIK